MAARYGARVKLNRRKVEAVKLALADGIHEFAKEIVRVANPPDATPYGEGLITTGGTLIYVDGKKVGGWHEKGGGDPPKPRGAPVQRQGITAFAGFGFPGRFQERGTSRMPANPFLTPARNQVMPRAASIMRKATSYRLKRLGVI